LFDKAPSEREVDILKALWELGGGRVRDVHRRLYPNAGAHFNTVQTVLRIMEKGSFWGNVLAIAPEA